MTWLVPSQTQTSGGYIVNTEAHTCSCPDFELRHVRCKHQWAVEFSQTIETDSSGNETVTSSFFYSRTTPRDWSAYNEGQTTEPNTVHALLRGLCDGVETPAHNGRGPKPIPMAGMAFAMVAKTYSMLSARRATCDVEAAATDGSLSRTPHYNSTLNYFAKPEMTAVLTKLIERSGAPLAGIEHAFAVDSTGFGTCVYHRWIDEKYGKPMKRATWLKAHAMVGTTTQIITAVRVTASDGADCPQLPELVESTKARFEMAEVSADRAYLSNDNLTAIEAAGASPFVPFKTNSQQDGSPAWRKMHAVFVLKEEEFLAPYSKRSAVESTFSALKRKFGPSVKSKTFTSQVNEIVCKVLCHNLSCLAMAMQTLDIKPSFLGLGEVQA